GGTRVASAAWSRLYVESVPDVREVAGRVRSASKDERTRPWWRCGLARILALRNRFLRRPACRSLPEHSPRLPVISPCRLAKRLDGRCSCDPGKTPAISMASHSGFSRDRDVSVPRGFLFPPSRLKKQRTTTLAR